MTHPHAVVDDAPGWYFLTNHALVLLAIARDPDVTMRRIAETVGITERAVRDLVHDLEAAGYITSTQVGRRKHYRLDRRRHFRHPMTARHSIGELLDVLAPASWRGAYRKGA